MQTRQDVQVEEGVVRSQVTLVYDITRSELTQLKLELPKAYKVVNVFDANVQKWEVSRQGERRRHASRHRATLPARQGAAIAGRWSWSWSIRTW